MSLITRPYDYSTLEGVDRLAVRLYNKPSRWFTTVVVQVVLGLWFVVAPSHLLQTIWITPTPHLEILCQLYGAFLIDRGLMEQFVRSRLELPWIYAMMISALPFELISSGVLIYACLANLMNPYIGWVWMLLFLASAAQHAYILVRHLLEKKSADTTTSPA